MDTVGEIGQIWKNHDVQMRLLLRTSYVQIGNAAVAAKLLKLAELGRTMDKSKALTIEERTQHLMFGIVATLQTKETEVSRKESFDVLLSILSDEPVFDTLREQLRSDQGKQVGIDILFMYMHM